ncbi:MAG TPA: potassium channel protein [bacterium]|nr:potassium channel protein [bacterium]
MLRNLRSETGLILFISMMVCLFAFGAAGYSYIEGWSFFDSLYMTVITLATVGFSEIHELSQAGRMFTIILIISGVATIGVGVQFFVAYIVRTNVFGNIWRLRMEQKIKLMKDHIIVCGYGKIGHHVVDYLIKEKNNFVIVDRELAEKDILEQKDILFIVGEATDEEVLKKAGVERASSLVAVVGSDADNLFITMSAKGLNPEIRVIARSEDSSTSKKLKRVGAEKVILPYEIGGRRIASIVNHPSIMEFLDTVMDSGNMELLMSEAVVSSGSAMKQQTLLKSEIRKKSGAIVLAIRKKTGLIINPEPETLIEEGDKLICLGTKTQIDNLQKYAKG